MISRMLGALLGGTTFGGHQVFDSVASSLMTPPNFGGGGGSRLPSMVVVALGEPIVPLICCAMAAGKAAVPRRTPNDSIAVVLILASPFCERFNTKPCSCDRARRLPQT